MPLSRYILAVVLFHSVFSLAADADNFATVRNILSKKLAKKFITVKNEPRRIRIAKPVFRVSPAYSESTLATLMAKVGSYTSVVPEPTESQLAELSLSVVRKELIRSQADVLIFTFVKAQSVAVYLYDRVAPYYLYAHEERYDASAGGSLSETQVHQYVQIALRRALVDYVEDQYFEIPRSQSPNVLVKPLPEWMDSGNILSRVNQEMGSRIYLGVGLGASLLKGKYDKGYWNSNVMSFNVGMRQFAQWYLEASYDAFAYHMFSGAIKTILSGTDSAIRTGVGVGYAQLQKTYTLSTDETQAFNSRSSMVFASAFLLFPITDVHLKVESRLCFSTKLDGAIFFLNAGVTFRL